MYGSTGGATVGVPVSSNEEPETDLATLVRMQQEIADLREANRNLQRKMLKSKQKNAELVEAVFEGAKDAMTAFGSPRPTKAPAPSKAKGKPQAALWHCTDWQGAKVTTSYNSEVMEERVMRFCKKAAKITGMHRESHPVKHCVIAFGGDLVEGLFNFPNQVFEIDATLFTQFVTVSRMIEQVVKYALSIYDTVEVVSEWGNHGRIGSIRNAVPRSDNVDRMCYEMARQLLRNEHRLIWADCPEDIQRLEIGNYRALVIHGDEVGRGGVSAPMTIARHADRWKSGAYPWDFRDIYVGHYHSHLEAQMANGDGAVFFTGSTESDNRYARDSMSASGRPSQRLHFVDPEKGQVTAQYRIYVDEDVR